MTIDLSKIKINLHST